MGQYLYSTYAIEGESSGAPKTPEEMQAFRQRVVAVEEEMDATGTFALARLGSRPDAIAPDLDTYHLMHAARGTMLRRLGQRDSARAAFQRAAHLAATDKDRLFFTQQIQELAADPTVRPAAERIN
jgi:predicted RNA polymerase sigma factor